MNFDVAILILAGLLALSVLAGKASSKLGIPGLLLFIGVGMLAGSDGPGGIWFSDAALAQHIGIVALLLILFSGGLDTHWADVRVAAPKAAMLATIGVAVTSGAVGFVCWKLLHFTVFEGLLIGSVVASTDASVVFSTLRGSGIRLRPELSAALELESGGNDPTAVFLTTTLLGILTTGAKPEWTLVPLYLWQMAFGTAGGFTLGRLGIYLIKRLQLDFDGLYSVLSIALALASFAGIELLGGNGFLAVYVAGLTLGSFEFEHKAAIRKFHDSVAWLMQICMFLVLGLLVFPLKLPAIAGSAILVACSLIFVARPLGVLVALLPFRMRLRDRVFVGWTGLRGAVPIILATYPLLAGIKRSQEIFDIVFFVVLLSSLLQGTTLPWVARALKVEEPDPALRPS